VAILAASALVPLALIARVRTVRSIQPRVHVIPDMDNQPKLQAQQSTPFFADGRAMRPEIPGTVARDGLRADDHYYRGKVDGKPATKYPVAVSHDLMQRGQDRFNTFCAPCHGLGGYGDGMVSQRADALGEGTWVPPPSFHTDQVRDRPVGEVFDIITNGIRKMPAHGPQIGVHDRWAIVAYVRALQLSRNARMEDVPPELRPALEQAR